MAWWWIACIVVALFIWAFLTVLSYGAQCMIPSGGSLKRVAEDSLIFFFVSLLVVFPVAGACRVVHLLIFGK
jgi:hypothetical protein